MTETNSKKRTPTNQTVPSIERSRLERKQLRSFLKRCYDKGIEIFPITPLAKMPPIGGYSSRKTFASWPAIEEFMVKTPNANLAAATGRLSGLFVVDVDGEVGRKSLRQLIKQNGHLSNSVRVKTPRGWHLWFAYPGVPAGNSASRIAPHIDVRGDGGYVLLPGSIGPNGERYRFVDGYSLEDVAIRAAPNWLVSLVTAPSKPSASQSNAVTHRANPVVRTEYGAKALRDESQKLLALPEGQRNDGLNKSAFRMGQLVASDRLDEGEAKHELLRAALSTGLSEAESIATIKSGLSKGQQSPRNVAIREVQADPAAGEAEEDSLAEELAKRGSQDIDNAARLYARFKDRLVYTAGGGWFNFDDRRWKRDESGAVLECAMDVARKIKNEILYKSGDVERQARSQHAARSGSRSAIDAMVHLARPAFTIADEMLDRDKLLLNVENGTIDLRMGELRPRNPRDFITKIVPISYDPEAKAPTFGGVINHITGGDREFKRYLQRVFGHCLTGDTTEQIFFFIVGRGGTGKSVLANVLRELLGESGVQASMDSFLTKQYDNQIPTDIARLRGARVVVAAEANIDRQIDEAKIKTLTGGDPLVARFMRQDFFEFMPEFKLVLIANDFPRVRLNSDASDAFWRRVRVIPIDRKVPAEEVDPNLMEKLRAEYPGILAWAVRGCLSWQQHGLPMPSVVKEGTDRWKGFADVVKRFVTDSCVLDPQAQVSASDIYSSYRNWCADHNENPQSQAGFKIKLRELDLTQRHERKGNIWYGIRLKD